jgi:hypothetical protein
MNTAMREAGSTIGFLIFLAFCIALATAGAH